MKKEIPPKMFDQVYRQIAPIKHLAQIHLIGLLTGFLFAVNTCLLPTNGGLKLMAKCVLLADGIDLRFLWPYAKSGHVKGVTGF